MNMNYDNSKNERNHQKKLLVLEHLGEQKKITYIPFILKKYVLELAILKETSSKIYIF